MGMTSSITMQSLVNIYHCAPVAGGNYGVRVFIYPRRARSALGVDTVLTLDVCLYVCMYVCMYVCRLC